MTEADDNSKIIRLERVDLDFASKPEAVERLERFLRDNRAEIGLVKGSVPHNRICGTDKH
jgi:hypothetical protein